MWYQGKIGMAKDPGRQDSEFLEQALRAMLPRDEMIKTIESMGRNKSNLRHLVEQLKTQLGVIPFVGAGLRPRALETWNAVWVS